ncbi:phosphatase PAP2 family protein [Corynebacterium sp.]|uniref:phosphatase PAP2 family protein n=1 Tax=Corynebacterium sp. TaxID=1720 RepID=UPI0025BA7347|nr:phosphatase PAP2 family protein [Corynebacterium sp.]
MPSPPFVPRVVGVVVLLLVLAAGATYPARDTVFRTVAGGAAESPLDGAVAVFTEAGLLALVVTAGAVAVWSAFRDREVLRRLVVGGVGVIVAYLVSEVTKNFVRQARPCSSGDVATVLTCPDAGSWAWPSNHSTIAAAFAVACAFALPRLGWFTVPLAVTAAFSRVAAGVHYVHDVLTGLALGLAVVVLTVTVLDRVVPAVPVPRELVRRPGNRRRPRPAARSSGPSPSTSAATRR